MKTDVIDRVRGRKLLYTDKLGLVHQCRGYAAGEHRLVFWTLCQSDAPAEAVRPQTPPEAITCPECLEVASRPARRILQAQRTRPRRAVGGPPYKEVGDD